MFCVPVPWVATGFRRRTGKRDARPIKATGNSPPRAGDSPMGAGKRRDARPVPATPPSDSAFRATRPTLRACASRPLRRVASPAGSLANPSQHGFVLADIRERVSGRTCARLAGRRAGDPTGGCAGPPRRAGAAQHSSPPLREA
eukprot:3034548-Pyramimonas_sp.AAC.1